MSAIFQNRLLFLALIVPLISVELLADSCFYVCNNGSDLIKSSSRVNCSTCQVNLTLDSVKEELNSSASINFENCTDCYCEAVSNTTLEIGHCMCTGNFTFCSSNITNGNETTTSINTTTTTTILCSNDTCLNGGICIETNITNYSCNCTEDFTGLRCENATWKNDSTCSGGGCGNSSSCSETTCSNNGTCVNNDTSFTCICPDRFNGSLCENDMCSVCTLKNESCSLNATSQEVQCTNASASTGDPTSLRPPTSPATETTVRPPPETTTSTRTTTAPPPAAMTYDPSVLTTMTREDHSVTTSPPAPEFDKKALIIGLTVGLAGLILIIAAIAVSVFHLKKSRATTGKYEPSREEKQGANIYFNILALPPEERLI